MKLYNCKVVVGGGQIEVPKLGITEYEIQVMRAIHGVDGVRGFRQVGEVQRTPQDECNELAMKYGSDTVEKVFGVKVARFAPIAEDEADDVVDLPQHLSLDLPESAPVEKQEIRVSGTTAPSTEKLAEEAGGKRVKSAGNLE